MDDMEKAMAATLAEIQSREEPEGIAEQTPVGTVEAAETEQPSTAAPRPRDANGQFIKADKADAEAPEEVETPKQTKAPEAKAPAVKEPAQPTDTQAVETTTQSSIPVPQSLSATAKAAFAKAPPDVQAEWARREAEMHKGITEQGTKYAEKARLADEIQSAAAPYAAMLQAEGATPATAFKSLLNTAYTLRTGTPAQRHQIIANLAQQFGVDLNAVASGERPYVDPHLEHTQNEVLQLKQMLAAEQYRKQQEAEAQTQQTLTAFQTATEADGKPKHPYFDDVRADMAALLSAGIAKDLPDAYDRAVRANPATFARLQAEQQAKAEAERVAAAKQKALQATKSAGTRVTSSDPQPEVKKTPRTQNDIEAEMRQTLRQIRAA